MNWIFFTAFGGINVPPGQFVCGFPSSAVVFFVFFLNFLYFLTPVKVQLRVFSTRLRKKKTNQSIYTVARLELRGRSAEGWTWTLEHNARFSPPASVFSREKVTLIWHGYIHNEHRWLRGGAPGNWEGIRGVNVTATFNPIEAGKERKSHVVGRCAAAPPVGQ